MPQKNNIANNHESNFSKQVIQNIMELFINPEVKRRQDEGRLPKPLKLFSAQVVLFPDERRHVVRINEEVRAIVKVEYKEGISKAKGDPVYENEIEDIEHAELAPDDDPDCGHIFLYFQGSTAFCSFDFRRNRALASNHIQRAKEYLITASNSLQSGHLAPFIDNLYNAAELSAKAVLLVLYDYPPSLRKKSSHKSISVRYNRFSNLGNVMPEYKMVFNKLSGLRDSARYIKGDPLTIGDTEAQKMLSTVSKMVSDAERNIGDWLDNVKQST